MPPFPPNTPLYHVSGRVIDDVTGRPISGATVNLSSLCKISSNSSSNNEQYFSQRALTGLDGSFDFDRIPPIAVNLEASKDNYLQVFTFRRTADDPLGSFVIGPNSDSVTLTIGPAASISGRVRGADGTPLGDAWVTLERLTAWAGWRRLESYNTIQTDASGNYRFGLLPPGRYFLVAQPRLGPAKPPAHDGSGKAVR
jgi:protocatechuate 3,4-dioxygenase beta subunit